MPPTCLPSLSPWHKAFPRNVQIHTAPTHLSLASSFLMRKRHQVSATHPRALLHPPSPLPSIPIIPKPPHNPSKATTASRHARKADTKKPTTWLSKPSCLLGDIKHSCTGHASKNRVKQQHYWEFKSTQNCFQTAIFLVDLSNISEDFYAAWIETAAAPSPEQQFTHSTALKSKPVHWCIQSQRTGPASMTQTLLTALFYIKGHRF